MPTKTRTSLGSKKRLGRFAGEWVVFIDNKIVAHNKTLAAAMAEVEKKGLAKKASVFRVPRSDEGPYVLVVML